MLAGVVQRGCALCARLAPAAGSVGLPSRCTGRALSSLLMWCSWPTRLHWRVMASSAPGAGGASWSFLCTKAARSPKLGSSSSTKRYLRAHALLPGALIRPPAGCGARGPCCWGLAKALLAGDGLGLVQPSLPCTVLMPWTCRLGTVRPGPLHSVQLQCRG